MTYRMTSVEAEAALTPPDAAQPVVEYVQLKNPLTPERSVMRRSLLGSVLEIARKNVRQSPHIALFEIAPVFLPQKDSILPQESQRLAIVLTGSKQPGHWNKPEQKSLDFYDLKGIIESFWMRCTVHRQVSNLSVARFIIPARLRG